MVRRLCELGVGRDLDLSYADLLWGLATVRQLALGHTLEQSLS